jgi:hypothetical protein
MTGNRSTYEAVGRWGWSWLRSVGATAAAFALFSSEFGSFVLGQSLLQVRCCFELGLFGRPIACSTRNGVASGSLSVGLSLVEVGQDALVVSLDNVFGDAFHAEDLNIETLAIRERIVDGSQVLFVDLAHMYAQTWQGLSANNTCSTSDSQLTSGRVQSTPASLALEVFRFLMID